MSESAVPSPDNSLDSLDKQALLEELQRTQLAYQMACEMSQFKAGFLARISHEIRAPLNGLIGLHQLILADLCESPEEEREFVQQAHTAALKLIKLLDDILDVARTEYGSNQLTLQPISLADVLTEVHHLTSLQAANRNLPLKIQIPNPDITVLADRRWFNQVLLNLVDTPLRLMGNAGEGSLELLIKSSENGYATIWIEDFRPADAWAEPIGRLAVLAEENAAKTAKTPPAKDAFQADAAPQTLRELAPALSLGANRTIMELMQGSLTVLATPTANASETADIADLLTRIQCVIPLAPTEALKP